MKHIKKLSFMILAICLSPSAFAENSGGNHREAVYEVTVTNLTKGIAFTPILGATHKPGMQLFTLGEASSDNVANVAEGGDISGLKDELDSSVLVANTVSTAGLLMNGQSVTFEVSASRRFSRISLISMLLPTNDTMVSLRSKKLPRRRGQTVHYNMRAYDAGSEANDELCVNIPGPVCGGNPFSAPDDSDEGYSYPSPGIHGEADLAQSLYDWNGAVAKVKIKRIN
jgi:hypothetical protein